MENANIGLHDKYHVQRADGRDAPGDKHAGCKLFVLDLTHDPFARIAALTYASACQGTYPQLAADLRAQVQGIKAGLATPDPTGTLKVAAAEIPADLEEKLNARRVGLDDRRKG